MSAYSDAMNGNIDEKIEKETIRKMVSDKWGKRISLVSLKEQLE